MSCRRNGLREQVTEAKVGPLQLRRKRKARKAHLGERVGAAADVFP